MFFLDSAGFFSLISLIIQCLVAWMFAAFFGVLLPGQLPWLRQWRRAFIALGIGLFAIGLRFSFAYHAVAGDVPWPEGAAQVRVSYGLYLAGKLAFAWYLLAGIRALVQGRAEGHRWWPLILVTGGLSLGALLPSIEVGLLVQAPWLAYTCWRGARLLLRTAGEERDVGRTVVARALQVMSAAWMVYAFAVLQIGSTTPQELSPWTFVLRCNSMIDLGLQIVLATGLIIVVMNEAKRTAILALSERDRLREQVQRDESLRALTTLVGGVAHEINNPLTAILGFAADLKDSDRTLRERAADVVVEQAERCRAIVRRMSVLGRNPSLSCDDIDVRQLVPRVLRGFEREVAQKHLSMQHECDGLHRPLRGDPAGFEQVLSNLLANAIQASPVFGRILVRTIARPDWIDLSVEDQGPGVPVADRLRIFEPFWTTKQVGQGTGLGLAVVADMVRAHGGDVAVGAGAAGGARFVVRWPWTPSRAAPLPAATALPAAPAGPALPVARRVLVVDDEELVRATIARQARSDGWTTVEATSADQALAILASDPAFDAIVCDLRMPGLSGQEFHDRIATSLPRLLKRLLFVTGDCASAESVAFAQRCAAPILGKPFAGAELCGRLRDVVQSA